MFEILNGYIFTVGYFAAEHSGATTERWSDHVHVEIALK